MSCALCKTQQTFVMQFDSQRATQQTSVGTW